MRVAQIRKYDVANGPGVRTSVFFSGCTHNCKGCFNKKYQDFSFGKLFTKEKQDEVIEHLKETKHLSILGGEPMQQGWELLDFIKRVKAETEADIWLWSGYTIEELMSVTKGTTYRIYILNEIDTLVDGRFVEEKKNLSLKFRGSSNQRIIDVKKYFEDLM